MSFCNLWSGRIYFCFSEAIGCGKEHGKYFSVLMPLTITKKHYARRISSDQLTNVNLNV